MGHNASISARKFDAVMPGFTFTKPERPVSDKPKPERRKTKPITYPLINVRDRHGDGWPRIPGRFPRFWTGWLTHREYNLIEQVNRFQVTDLYRVGEAMGLKYESTQRMFHAVRAAGILTEDSVIDEFEITPMAQILFDMTDQYILELDLGDT